jgi:(p)ppGpp synthase/HD superfamily hydrolase
MNKIIKAARFADAKHSGQLRKYTDRPYIEHPARVATRMMLRAEADEDMVCAAWLHDVCEDCGVTKETITHEFGWNVADIVEGLTNRSKIDFPKADRAERKRIDFERLANCARRDVKTIKLLDRIDNLREMDLAPAEFRQIYCNESKLLIAAIGDVSEELKAELLSEIHRLDEGRSAES